MNASRYAAIFVVIERGKADNVVQAARNAGASGATVFFGRGTGDESHLNLFKIQVESMKEVVFTIVPEHLAREVIAAISAAASLSRPGTGILFSMPVDFLVGLEYRDTTEEHTSVNPGA